jgi:hypothetical protein
MIHFVKHPHLHPVETTPPPPTVTLIERLKRNGIFVLYGAVGASSFMACWLRRTEFRPSTLLCDRDAVGRD